MNRSAPSSHVSPVPRVAVLFSPALKGQRSTMRGILDYAGRHGPWFCLLQEGRGGEQEIDWRRGVDGVIVSGVTRKDARPIAALKVPVVVIEPRAEMLKADFPLQGAPYVLRDSHAIGAFAADYYLGRGYRSFAFVGDPEGHSWSAERRRGFEERLAEMGFPCASFDRFNARERRSFAVERPRLERFLLSLPRPTAIFCPMDGRARLVLDACFTAELRVPEDIAVLGVDNDEILCNSTVPALSSIRTGGFRRGLLAAEMLDNLMHGRPVKKRAIAQEPLSVVSRGSTGYDAMRDPFIAKAIAFIRSRGPADRATPTDVVAAAGCSRRHLEKRFRTLLGFSLRDALLRSKLETVKKLLETTSLSMEEIAGRCAFATESHLAVLFKKATGRTMRDWRRENRETPDE